MSNVAVKLNVVLRLRSALIREGNRSLAAVLKLNGGNEAARYQWEG